MRNTILLLLSYFICSCSTKQSNKEEKPNPSTPKSQIIDTIAVFVDSTSNAIPNRNKILLVSIVIDDSIPKTVVNFFKKKDNSWELQYSFNDEHWHPSDILITDVADYNSDGYKDFKYSKGVGARGGNSIQNLFIYDRKGDSLAYVLNSNDYPNLYYNKETNSINSYILTGGNETLFMRLEGNKLTPYASIEQYGKMVTVTEYDNKGRSTVIFSDSSVKYTDFAHFTNFKPLKVEE